MLPEHFNLLTIQSTLTHQPTWVGDHHQDAVGAVLDNIWDDELEDVNIALHQVETALSLLLTGTSSHHDHPGVGCHTVVWQFDRKTLLHT